MIKHDVENNSLDLTVDKAEVNTKKSTANSFKEPTKERKACTSSSTSWLLSASPSCLSLLSSSSSLSFLSFVKRAWKVKRNAFAFGSFMKSRQGSARPGGQGGLQLGGQDNGGPRGPG